MKTLNQYMIIALMVSSGCSFNNNEADAYGNFEAENRYVSTEVSGKINLLKIEEGDLLEQSQIIAVIDTTQLSLKKKQLQATIRSLKSQLLDIPIQMGSLYEQRSILKREIKRTKTLLADSAATSKQLDDLSGELLVTKQQIQATKSKLTTTNQSILAQIEPISWQIKQIDDQLNKSVIRAPIKGTVLEKFKEPAELIMAGQPLIKIANLKEMTLRAFVAENQLGNLEIGKQVTLRVDAPDGTLKKYPATISWVASEAEFTPKVIQTKEERTNLVYAVKFRVKNDGFIKIGMPGEVLFK